MRNRKIVQYPLSQSSRKEGRICERGMTWVWNERAMEWWMVRVMIMKEMRWLVKEVNQEETGEDGADEMIPKKLISKTWRKERSVILRDELVSGRARTARDEKRVMRGVGERSDHTGRQTNIGRHATTNIRTSTNRVCESAVCVRIEYRIESFQLQRILILL